MKTKEFIKLIDGADFTIEDCSIGLKVMKLMNYMTYSMTRGGGIGMNKQELIKSLNFTRDSYDNEDDFRSGVRTGLALAIFEIEQLDEPVKPSKPVIPQFVAEQLEYWKRNKMNILWQFFLREIPSYILSWLENDVDNYDKLIDAEKNGYEVEKENLWEVPMPDLKTSGGHIQYLTYDPKARTYFATRKNGKLKQTFNAKDLASVPGQYRRHAEMCGFKKIQEVVEC